MQDDGHALEERFEAARVAAIEATDRYRGLRARGVPVKEADLASESAAAERARRETTAAVRYLETLLRNTRSAR